MFASGCVVVSESERQEPAAAQRQERSAHPEQGRVRPAQPGAGEWRRRLSAVKHT